MLPNNSSRWNKESSLRSLLAVTSLVLFTFFSITAAQSTNNGRVVSEYEPEQNVTFVMLRPMMVSGGSMCRGGVDLVAEFRYNGQTPLAPEYVSVGFFNPPGRGLDKGGFVAVVDGEHLPLDNFAQENDLFRQQSPCRNLVNLSGVKIPTAKFMKIARAKKLEFLIGDKQITMLDPHLEGLRELADRIPNKK